MLVPKLTSATIKLTNILTSVVDSSLDAIQGNLYTGEDQPRLEADEFGKVKLTGSIPAPIFGCDIEDGDFAFSSIELNNLGVDNINPSSCCESSGNSIDVCYGRIDFSSEAANVSIQTDGVFLDTPGTGTTIQSGEATFSDSGGACVIAGGSITLTSGTGTLSLYPPEGGLPSWMTLTVCEGNAQKTITVLGFYNS
jgi:hypothetical protein